MSFALVYRCLLCLGVLLVTTAGAQEEPAGVLGQPAGWSVEDATTLIDIAEETALFLEPDRTASVLAVLPEGRLPLIESREAWVKVRFGDRVGWVDLEAPRLPRQPGARPLAPRIVIVPPKPEPLELGPGFSQQKLGPYTLHTQITEPRLIKDLATAAREHARIYTERYGLKVEEELLGKVVLFAAEREFREFQRSRGHQIFKVDTAGYFRTPDLVVLYRGSSSRQEVTAILLHELTHLLAFRTLRDSGRIVERLPKWLDEGIANDLALSSFDRKGQLRAAPLGPTNLQYGRRLGALVIEAEHAMVAAGTAPSLSKLLAMDKETYFGGDIDLHYLMSALLVRYLLRSEDPEMAERFRGFLAQAAEGGDTRPEELLSRLELSWPQLSSEFRRYLLRLKVRFGV